MSTPDPGRVLVTGATGLLGSNVTAALLASGAEVTALVRSAERDRRLLPEDERLRIVEGDITRVDDLSASATGPAHPARCPRPRRWPVPRPWKAPIASLDTVAGLPPRAAQLPVRPHQPPEGRSGHRGWAAAICDRRRGLAVAREGPYQVRLRPLRA